MRCVISSFGLSTPERTCSTSRGSSRFTGTDLRTRARLGAEVTAQRFPLMDREGEGARGIGEVLLGGYGEGGRQTTVAVSFGKGVGRSIREFKDEVKGVDGEKPKEEVVEAEIVQPEIDRNKPEN